MFFTPALTQRDARSICESESDTHNQNELWHMSDMSETGLTITL